MAGSGESITRGRIVGQLVNATGWFPDDILDRLTWGDFVELTEYWRDHPPLQTMVQQYLGIKPQPREEVSPDAFRSLVDSINRK